MNAHLPVLRDVLRAACCLALVCAGCRERAAGPAAGSDGPAGTVIARVGEAVITTADVDRRLAQLPPSVRAFWARPEERRKLVEELVRFELLAQEGERRGLSRAPAVREELRKLVVRELTAQEQAAPREISEADLRKAYDEHLTDYLRPESARVSRILIAGKGAEARKKAAALLASLREAAATQDASRFAEAARNSSDDRASALMGGDLRFQTRSELARLTSPALAEAAFALQRSGELSPVVDTPQGFEIVRLEGRQGAVERTFGQVRGELEARLSRERASKDLERLVGELRQKANVSIDDAALAAMPIAVDPAAAAPFQPPQQRKK